METNNNYDKIIREYFKAYNNLQNIPGGICYIENNISPGDIFYSVDKYSGINLVLVVGFTSNNDYRINFLNLVKNYNDVIFDSSYSMNIDSGKLLDSYHYLCNIMDLIDNKAELIKLADIFEVSRINIRKQKLIKDIDRIEKKSPICQLFEDFKKYL